MLRRLTHGQSDGFLFLSNNRVQRTQPPRDDVQMRPQAASAELAATSPQMVMSPVPLEAEVPRAVLPCCSVQGQPELGRGPLEPLPSGYAASRVWLTPSRALAGVWGPRGGGGTQGRVPGPSQHPRRSV